MKLWEDNNISFLYFAGEKKKLQNFTLCHHVAAKPLFKPSHNKFELPLAITDVSGFGNIFSELHQIFILLGVMVM